MPQDAAKPIDITPPIDPNIRVYPGDVAFRRTITSEMAQGDIVNSSAIQTTLHLGAHLDAPSHYVDDGRTIDEEPLDLYICPCQVIDVQGIAPRGRVGIAQLEGVTIDTPRVLFKTGSFPVDRTTWHDDWVGLAVELIPWLAARGVRLVGIDTPSVDAHDEAPGKDELPAHRAIGAHDLAILEGLLLADVPAGRYELIALPLKIVGADGSPVRAVLLPTADG
ncbi:MAG: cyclase family protein [Acidobacteriota bacterium]